MEFKGTKGEWIAFNKRVEARCHNVHVTICENVTGANQKLIVAAPELLEALQIYLNAGSKDQRREASVIAKKAINKALK